MLRTGKDIATYWENKLLGVEIASRHVLGCLHLVLIVTTHKDDISS